MGELLDARGVKIEPGDTCLYGFSVGRSVAMAEGEVVPEAGPEPDDDHVVSLTPSGRVRVRIVRRSYGGGEKRVVDVAPDRLVVLKSYRMLSAPGPYLPPSPLPTQGEERRKQLERLIEVYTENLRATEVPDGWRASLEDRHAWCAERLKELRKGLRELDDVD